MSTYTLLFGFVTALSEQQCQAVQEQSNKRSVENTKQEHGLRRLQQEIKASQEASENLKSELEDQKASNGIPLFE